MMKLYLLSVFLCVAIATPIQESRTVDVSRSMLEKTIFERTLQSAPRDARFLSLRSNQGPVSAEELKASLIDNATLIRENIVGGFDCTGRKYGYYADVANECQIFHVCVNMNQLYPKLYKKDFSYRFSFICPGYTIFTQDAMVCAFERSAIPCNLAEQLYYLNENFFVVPPEDVPKVKETKKPKTEKL